MCGGGKIPAPDPMAEAQAAFWLEQQRSAHEADLLGLRKKDQQQFFDNQSAQRQQFIDDSYNRFLRDFSSNYVGLTGDDYEEGFTDSFSPLLQEMLRDFYVAPSGDLVSNTYNNTNTGLDNRYRSLVTDFNNTKNNEWRNTQSGAIKDIFRPNFESNIFSDTLDDSYIPDILLGQYNDAATKLENAYKRGQLNQSGLDFARRRLDEAKSGAQTKLSQLGNDVLSGYRADALQLRDKAYNERDQLSYGDTLSDYSTMLNDLVSERTGRLQGDIVNSLGGEQLFNVGDLIQRAGGYQGPTNINFSTPNQLKLSGLGIGSDPNKKKDLDNNNDAAGFASQTGSKDQF